MRSNLQVTSSNPRVPSSNPRVMSSNPRVWGHPQCVQLRIGRGSITPHVYVRT